MVWVWRACLAILIAAYAGWLLWPVIAPLTDGGSFEEPVSALRSEAQRLGWALPSLWIASAVLYLIAAGLTAGGVGAAPGAYFLAFLGEVVQRLLLQSTSGAALTDTPDRIAAALAPLGLAVDPGPASLATLLAVGLLVLLTGAWRVRAGQALTRDWTRPPVYA